MSRYAHPEMLVDTLALGAPSKTIPCYFSAFGNHIVDNIFAGNGSFGNPTNGDLANSAIDYSVNNCFSGNINLNSAQPTSAPAYLQSNGGGRHVRRPLER